MQSNRQSLPLVARDVHPCGMHCVRAGSAACVAEPLPLPFCASHLTIAPPSPLLPCRYSWDRKPVNWDFVSCGSSGSSKGRKQCPKGKRGAKCRRQRTLL